MNRAEVLQKTIKDLYGVQIDNVEGILKTGGLAGLRKALDNAGVESAEKQLQTKVEGEPPANAEGEPKPDERGIAELMKQVIDEASGLAKTIGEYKAAMDAQGAKQVATEKSYTDAKAAQDAVIADLSSRLKAAEEKLALKPRSAIGNEASAEIGAALKDKLPASATELDPMFKELGVLKK